MPAPRPDAELDAAARSCPVEHLPCAGSLPAAYTAARAAAPRASAMVPIELGAIPLRQGRKDRRRGR